MDCPIARECAYVGVSGWRHDGRHIVDLTYPTIFLHSQAGSSPLRSASEPLYSLTGLSSWGAKPEAIGRSFYGKPVQKSGTALGSYQEQCRYGRVVQRELLELRTEMGVLTLKLEKVIDTREWVRIDDFVVSA